MTEEQYKFKAFSYISNSQSVVTYNDIHATTSSVPLQKEIPSTDCVMVKHKGYQLSAQKSEASLEIL